MFIINARRGRRRKGRYSEAELRAAGGGGDEDEQEGESSAASNYRAEVIENSSL